MTMMSDRLRRPAAVSALSVFVLALAGCAGSMPTLPSLGLGASAGAFTLSSPDIPAGSVIAGKFVLNGFGCKGENVSPALVWSNPPAGTKFDPHQHQAISMVPADQDPNTVVSVLQKGYLIAERVLRPALVMVAAPK